MAVYETLPTFCTPVCPCATGCALPMCLEFLTLKLLVASMPAGYIPGNPVYVELKRADGIRTILPATMVLGFGSWTATLPLAELFTQGWITLIDRVTFQVQIVSGGLWQIAEYDCVEVGFYFDNYNEVETMPLIIP